MSCDDLDLRVRDVELPFRLVDAGDAPGAAWAAQFARAWPSYRQWYLREGEEARPTYAESRDALRRWLPELHDDWERAVDAAGGGDIEARLLSHWCPPPLVSACSLALLGGPAPALVRNYDYAPLLVDALALRSRWSGRAVIGMADLGLGLLDGVNGHGLAVAIAFGGRPQVGPGFGIGIIVRWVLQTCATVDEAVARLATVPVRMSFNVALVDAAGARTVVRIAPDRPADSTGRWSAANRQGATEWPEHAAYSNTVEREELLEALVGFPLTDRDDLVAAFLRPPLFRPLADSTWGTVYTVAYDPATAGMTLLWPDDRWELRLDGADEGARPRRALALVPEPRVEQVAVEAPRRTDFLR